MTEIAHKWSTMIGEMFKYQLSHMAKSALKVFQAIFGGIQNFLAFTYVVPDNGKTSIFAKMDPLSSCNPSLLLGKKAQPHLFSCF